LRLQNAVNLNKYRGIYNSIGKLWKVENFAANDKALKRHLQNHVKKLGKIGDLMQEIQRPNPAGVESSIYKMFAEGVNVYEKTGDLKLAMRVTVHEWAFDASEIAGTAGTIEVLKNVRKINKVSKRLVQQVLSLDICWVYWLINGLVVMKRTLNQ